MERERGGEPEGERLSDCKAEKKINSSLRRTTHKSIEDRREREIDGQNEIGALQKKSGRLRVARQIEVKRMMTTSYLSRSFGERSSPIDIMYA